MVKPAAIDAIKSSLRAQDWHISLTLSLFILLSGIFPMPWSLTSELVGRKVYYDTLRPHEGNNTDKWSSVCIWFP
jgi:hypothetical protein